VTDEHDRSIDPRNCSTNCRDIVGQRCQRQRRCYRFDPLSFKRGNDASPTLSIGPCATVVSSERIFSLLARCE
jgi:hypothetical protein